MDCAQIDGIPLFGDRGGRSSGAIFTLNSRARRTGSVRVGAKWTVLVREGSDALVVRGGRAGSYAKAWDNGLEAAQRGLDILSLRAAGDLAVRDPDEAHIVWWQESRGLVLRLFGILTTTPEFSITLSVRNPSGRWVRPTRSKPVWHESFRFFRLAQVTDDVFDAYRNLYLALECLLDDLCPYRGGPEMAWLKRALASSKAAPSIVALAPPGSKDPLRDVVHDVYSLTRTAVFHAKARQRHLTPGVRKEREQVRETLEELARLYLTVVHHELGTQRGASGISSSAVSEMMDSVYGSSLVLVVSDDAATFDPGETSINPSGGAVVTLATRAAPEYDASFVRNWLGAVEVSRLSGLSRIARVGALQGDGVQFVQTLENVLTVGGFDILEAQLARRVENKGPRRLYPR